MAVNCRQKCIDLGYTPGTADFQTCLRNCREEKKEEKEEGGGGGGGNGGGGTPGSPCKGGGYKPPTIIDKDGRAIQTTPCKEGYVPVRMGNTPWCCAEEAEKKEEEEEKKEEGNGEISEGCYKLADNPIPAQGGKIWTDDLITAEMGFYRPGNVQGHWVHKGGKWYTIEDIHNAVKKGSLDSLQGVEGSACKKGYKRVTKDGVVYCCPDEKAAGKGAGGEFKWSQEIRDAIRNMLARYEEILDRPFGLTDEERQSIINYATTGLKRAERGDIQALRDELAGVGLLGQPAEVGEIERIKRGTSERVADVRGRLALDEIDRTMQDLLTTTGSAAQILQLLLQTEQIPEVLSSARRQEGTNQMALLMQYLNTLMGGQSNAYWQALFNFMNKGGGGGSIWDWLPDMGYYIGREIQG